MKSKSSKLSKKLPKVNGKTVYGSWKNGEDIYKDSKGFFVQSYNTKTKKIYKKHIKYSMKSKSKKSRK